MKIGKISKKCKNMYIEKKCELATERVSPS